MRLLSSVLTWSLLALLCATTAHANLLGTELVVNGGAETGDETGWISNGIEAVVPDAAAQGFGDFAFTGGLGPASSQTLQQSIDVSGLSLEIDNGDVISSFSIYLQTRAAPGLLDTAEAALSFLDDLDVPIESEFFEDTINVFGNDWNQFADVRVVPAGTRSIDILLNATRGGGVSSDGFFDEVSLRIVPEPSSLAILAIGGAYLLRRRVL